MICSATHPIRITSSLRVCAWSRDSSIVPCARSTLERTDAPGELYATGGAKTVWVNYRAERSVPLPDAIRAVVGAAPGDRRDRGDQSKA